MRSASPLWNQLIQLTFKSQISLQAQIREILVAAILDGQIPVGVALPSTRVLARQLGVTVCGEFGEEYGVPIGVWGELDAPRAALEQALRTVLGVEARVMPFGPERVRRVGVVTGGAGSMITQAAAAGLDTYVTGEGAHHTFFDAEELGLNVFYAGHYATETVGVKALAAHLAAQFGLPWTFLHHPTGL